jgi:hypothetical protein
VDAKIIRDGRGVSKGLDGFIDMRNDDVGEEQTRDLLKQRTFLYCNNHNIVFKPAFRKSLTSQVFDILGKGRVTVHREGKMKLLA